MSELSQVKRELEDVQEKLEELVRKAARNCTECKCTIKGTDEAYCDECGAPPDCDGCGSEITDGFCQTCATENLSEAEDAALAGSYPEIGMNRRGAVPDQILEFLMLLRDTCCKSEPRLCARCSDAEHLRTSYTATLGGVRA